jgi:hypothetical protein
MYKLFDFITSSSDQKPNPETTNSEKKIAKIKLFILDEKYFSFNKTKVNSAFFDHFDSQINMSRGDLKK